MSEPNERAVVLYKAADSSTDAAKQTSQNPGPKLSAPPSSAHQVGHLEVGGCVFFSIEDLRSALLRWSAEHPQEVYKPMLNEAVARVSERIEMFQNAQDATLISLFEIGQKTVVGFNEFRRSREARHIWAPILAAVDNVKKNQKSVELARSKVLRNWPQDGQKFLEINSAQGWTKAVGRLSKECKDYCAAMTFLTRAIFDRLNVVRQGVSALLSPGLTDIQAAIQYAIAEHKPDPLSAMELSKFSLRINDLGLLEFNGVPPFSLGQGVDIEDTSYFGEKPLRALPHLSETLLKSREKDTQSQASQYGSDEGTWDIHTFEGDDVTGTHPRQDGATTGANIGGEDLIVSSEFVPTAQVDTTSADQRHPISSHFELGVQNSTEETPARSGPNALSPQISTPQKASAGLIPSLHPSTPEPNLRNGGAANKPKTKAPRIKLIVKPPQQPGNLTGQKATGKNQTPFAAESPVSGSQEVLSLEQAAERPTQDAAPVSAHQTGVPILDSPKAPASKQVAPTGILAGMETGPHRQNKGNSNEPTLVQDPPTPGSQQQHFGGQCGDEQQSSNIDQLANLELLVQNDNGSGRQARDEEIGSRVGTLISNEDSTSQTEGQFDDQVRNERASMPNQIAHTVTQDSPANVSEALIPEAMRDGPERYKFILEDTVRRLGFADNELHEVLRKVSDTGFLDLFGAFNWWYEPVYKGLSLSQLAVLEARVFMHCHDNNAKNLDSHQYGQLYQLLEADPVLWILNACLHQAPDLVVFPQPVQVVTNEISLSFRSKGNDCRVTAKGMGNSSVHLYVTGADKDVALLFRPSLMPQGSIARLFSTHGLPDEELRRGRENKQPAALFLQNQRIMDVKPWDLSTTLRGLSPCSDAVLSQCLYNDIEVQAECDILLGIDRDRAWNLVLQWRSSVIEQLKFHFDVWLHIESAMHSDRSYQRFYSLSGAEITSNGSNTSGN